MMVTRGSGRRDRDPTRRATTTTYVPVKHQVEDYDRWKPGFDARAAGRKEMGSCGARAFRVEGSPTEQFILMEYRDGAAAHAFAESDRLRNAMASAGVAGQPEVYFLDEVDSRPA